MKKILLFSLLAVFAATSVNAQKKNAIKVRPLLIVLGYYDLMYERGLNANTSLSLEFAFMNWNLTELVKQNYTGNSTINSSKISGYTITPQFRYYFKGESPKGFYVNPFVQYGNYSVAQSSADLFVNITNSSATINTRGIGTGLGYQWQFGAFTLDWNFIGFGVQSVGMNFTFDAVSLDNIDYAEGIRDNLNNSGFFSGYELKLTQSGGIEVNAPAAAFLPMFKSNLSIGVCF